MAGLAEDVADLGPVAEGDPGVVLPAVVQDQWVQFHSAWGAHFEIGSGDRDVVVHPLRENLG